MDTTVSPEETEQQPTAPLSLGRHDHATRTMLKRVAPGAVPDGGVSQLDVAAFTSSI